MGRARRFLTAVFLSALPISSKQTAPEKSVLLFGMLTMDKKVSACTYLAAKIEYAGGFASFTDLHGLDETSGLSGVAGTVVCPERERASSSGSTSYLITIPTSAEALGSSSYGLVKLFGVQVAGNSSVDGLGGPDDVISGDVGGDGAGGTEEDGVEGTVEDTADQEERAPSLVVKQYVLVPTVDKKVNVDVDMMVDGVRVDLGARDFSSSMDGVECRSIMRRVFGQTPEVLWWADGGGERAGGDLSDVVGQCDGTTVRAAGPVCCGRRPTMACAGIGVGMVLVVWLVSMGLGGSDGRGRKGTVDGGATGTVKQMVSVDAVETPDKKVGVRHTDVREWKREGDRLRRDIKRQSADIRTTATGAQRKG